MPDQVTNDVAFKRFVAAKIPQIPVPRVYCFEATDRYQDSFTAEEFIQDATTLSSAWMTLTLSQKEKLARDLARTFLDLTDVCFDKIGGLDPTDFSSAPTVEGSKIFKGRSKLHRPGCYPLGPYLSTKEYILACYDKEICYYTRPADEEDIDGNLFQDTTVAAFVESLREKRAVLSETEFPEEEPFFVLVHGDLSGRNIMVRKDDGGKGHKGEGISIVAVLDWDFAGSYPLSETLTGGTIDVVEMTSDELCEENFLWEDEIRDLIRQEAESRGGHWGDGQRIELLLGDGNRELATARTEMVPSFFTTPGLL